MESLTVQTPAPDHVQFDQICAQVDEFEQLPAVSSGPLEFAEDDQEDTGLDGQILAGLVTPAY